MYFHHLGGVLGVKERFEADVAVLSVQFSILMSWASKRDARVRTFHLESVRGRKPLRAASLLGFGIRLLLLLEGRDLWRVLVTPTTSASAPSLNRD